MRILSILFILIMAACSEPHGKVIDKYMVPAHDVEYQVAHKIGKVTYYTHEIEHIPDTYFIVLTENDQRSETQINWNLYNNIKIGDFYGYEKR